MESWQSFRISIDTIPFAFKNINFHYTEYDRLIIENQYSDSEIVFAAAKELLCFD